MRTSDGLANRINATAGVAVFSVFALVAIVVYWPILNNTLIGDDYFYTVKVGELSFSGLGHLFDIHPSFVRPLPTLVFWLQFKLFGVAALPSHLINVIIHAANAFLLFCLLVRLGISRNASLLCGFLFLITPVAVEPVTWSSGRFDLMSTFFVLLASVLYLASVKNRSTAAFAGAIAAAFSAMFSKESAMALVLVFPAIELIYGILGEAGNSGDTGARRGRWRRSGIRLVIFYSMFAGYIALRYAILGRLGGYRDVPFIAVPDLLASTRTIWTFLSPVSSQLASRQLLLILAGIFLMLLTMSQVLVLIRWKQASAAARKAWLFLVVMTAATIVPVNTQLFSFGIGSNLRDSRELYIVSMLAIAIMVIGLFEFGWRKKEWRVMATISVLLLVPLWSWGVVKNNSLWEESAAVSSAILEGTQELLPEPPPDSRLYYLNVPEWDGAYVFVTALKYAVASQYGRKDLQVVQIRREDVDFDINDTADGYLLVYDREQTRIVLIHGPL